MSRYTVHGMPSTAASMAMLQRMITGETVAFLPQHAWATRRTNPLDVCQYQRMTELQVGVIPTFHRGDRLAKALDYAGMTNVEMAEYLGVGTATISRWVHDRSPVRRGTLLLWAMRTGVDLEWLETGMAPQREPGGQVRHQGLEPRTRWFTAEQVAA